MSWILAGLVVAAAVVGTEAGPEQTKNQAPGAASSAAAAQVDASMEERIVAAEIPGPSGLPDLNVSPALRALISEVLERNPGLHRMRFEARAAAQRSPQAGALPDAMAGLSLFALPPETRVGPQRLTASVSQRFPGRGKRSLASSGMELEAEAADHRMEAERLRLATETRRHVYELAFLAERAEILAEEREHLVRHEELARARYASGAGLQQEAVKIQAAITRREQALLDLEILRRRHLASLNALRDRPADTDAEGARLPSPEPLALELMALRPVALSRRPDLAAARSMSAAAARQVELAEKAAVPDWTVGLGYTLVDRRQDEAGRRLPPQGNGNDILALNASVSLPVWSKRRTAQLQEALERQSSAREQERLLTAQFEADLGEVAGRLPLLYQQWHLFETVLEEQAQEALRSAESAYTTGRLNALDLLDAEHVLFEVRTGKARAAADWALAWADLEGVLATAVPREED